MQIRNCELRCAEYSDPREGRGEQNVRLGWGRVRSQLLHVWKNNLRGAKLQSGEFQELLSSNDHLQGVDSVTYFHDLGAFKAGQFTSFIPQARKFYRSAARKAINLTASARDAAEDEVQQDALRPLREANFVPIPLNEVIALIRSELLSARAPFVLKGNSARMPREDGLSAEVFVDFSSGKRGEINVRSMAISGSADAPTVTEMTSSDDLAILLQAAVYQNGVDAAGGPIVLGVNGTEITPASMVEIVKFAGLNGPLAIEAFGNQGLKSQAIGRVPSEPLDPDRDIFSQLDVHDTSVVEGKWHATGICDPSNAWAASGHLHVKHMDGDPKGGGHFVAATGPCVVVINPLDSVLNATYEMEDAA